MIKWIKKVDTIVLILVLTILVGVIVITFRSRTYYIGYNIAKLKGKEKDLREQNDELRIDLSVLRRTIRNSLLNEKDALNRPKFILPDTSHVIVENE